MVHLSYTFFIVPFTKFPITALFVAIVEGLLIEKPTNPIAFIIEFLCKSYPDLAVQARIPELLQVVASGQHH